MQGAKNPNEKVVSLFLGPGDRRFGFSVIGGSDEPIPSRIDDIAPGKYTIVIQYIFINKHSL